MMTKPSFGQLLPLLLLAVATRSSSANPMASPDGMKDGAVPSYNEKVVVNQLHHLVRREAALGHSTSSIAEDMKKGAGILTNTMNWLREYVQSSLFHEEIRSLEYAISRLPSEFEPFKRNISKGLYRSKDSITTLRTTLKQAAQKLESYCGQIIDMYKSNVISETLLFDTAKEFVKYSKDVKGIFEKAVNQTEDINEVLRHSKSSIAELRARLNERRKNTKKSITANSRAIERNDQKIRNERYRLKQARKEAAKKAFGFFRSLFRVGRGNISGNLVEFSMALHATESQASRLRNEQDILYSNVRKDEELLRKIATALNSAGLLHSRVDGVRTYMVNEIGLMNKLHSHLDEAIMNNEDISVEMIAIVIDIEIDLILESFVLLRKACVDYIGDEVMWPVVPIGVGVLRNTDGTFGLIG